jgi:hypothetical protein
MSVIRATVLRWSLFAALVTLAPAAAQAALITTVGHDITGLDLTLLLTPESAAAAGTTTLSYDVALRPDDSAEWQIVGFTVLRDWTEGAYAGSPAVAAPTGWAVDPTAHFVNWDVHTGDVRIAEGESLGGFAYTFFGDTPTDQLFRYLVSRDGGTPFQVLSNEVSLAPAVVIPEPRAALLVALPLAGLMYRHRA